VAVVDIAIARERPALRRLAAALSLGAVAWTAFITAYFARDAYRAGQADHLLRGLHLIPELQVMLGAGAIALALGVAAYVTRPRLLAALKAAACGAALGAMAFLTVTSGQDTEPAVFAGMIAWAWLAGGPFLAALERGQPLLTAWPRAALEAALGLAALSFAVLGLALAGLLGDAGLAAVFGLGVVLALGARRRRRAPWFMSTPDLSTSPDRLFVEYVALALLAVTMAATFGASLAPQTQFDALHYHFAVPRIFLAEGRFVERPDIIQSYFPQGMEMTYVPALRFGGETSMTLLNWAMAPLLAALLWGAGNRFFGRPAGAFGAALVGLAALVSYEAPSASSDLAMTFWLLAAAVALGVYATAPSKSAALMTGLFGGLALTFKIVAGIYLFPLALAFATLLVTSDRHPPAARLRDALAFAGGGLLTGAPWLLIRLVQTGNPIFPLYNDVFRSDKWPPVREKFDLWLYGIGHSPADAVSVWWEVALHPWRFGQWLPPWAIGLPVLAFAAVFVRPAETLRGRPRAALFLLAGLAALAWFLLSQYHRYGLPAFALLGLVGGAAVWGALRALPGRLSATAAVALLATWAAGGAVLTLTTGVPDPYPSRVVLGHETRAAYRDRAIAGYAPLSFLDEAMRGTTDAAGLVGYPYNFFVVNRVYDITEPPELSPFTAAAKSGAPPAAMAAMLLDAGVRWVLVDYNLLAEQPPPDWLARGILSPEFLQSQTEVAFQKYNVVVYRILDRGQAR
jgi:4-amino-4-deoxy-L-arabinose transferase-like glycosyltransferase